MFCRSRLGFSVLVTGALLLAVPASAYDIYAGVSMAIHQDIPDGTLPDGRMPNDFHIEGYVCTANGGIVAVSSILNDVFPSANTTFSVTQISPEWYVFSVDWWLDPGHPGIPYCTLMNIGLLFTVEDENVIIDMSAWWTLDGVPVGQIYGGYQNGGFTPFTGFDVTPTAEGQIVRIGGGVVPPIILPPPIPGPGPWPMPIEIAELDVFSAPPSTLPANWFQELYDGGAQGGWAWTPVLDGSGLDVNPGNPIGIAADSFFDIYLGGTPGMGQVTPTAPVTINAGDLFFVRTRRTFVNNAGVPDPTNSLWEWHIHEAQGPEACCFPDGSCQDLAPVDCAAQGGFPMGVGTDCSTTQCQGGDEEACCLPDNTCVVMLASDCLAQGGTPMGAPTCDGVVCVQSDFLFEFSLDIGSDKELSDPQVDGDEAFDPGDVYWWQGAPVAPPGRDGFKDDMAIFGLDPWPAAPDPSLTTKVPVGAGSIQDFVEYFDLDAHDQIDFSLEQAEFPYPQVASNCIYKPEFLMISFDDDTAPSWPMFDVPVTAPSPAGVSSYGSTPGGDEVIGVNLGITPFPPYAYLGSYPIADELTVHSSLAPNPDGIEEEDDDVDSLDIVEGADTCPFWYFSPDHEAHYGLDPGGVYLVTGGGPVQVIDEAFHLGIPEETDIDAFEFTWIENPEQPGAGLFLALLYSVDEDDPFTSTDESGGMIPFVIYASFMNGFSFPLSDPLNDDIDAITIWREPLGEPNPVGACCLPSCGCAVMLEVDCINNGGVWAGAGTDCTDADGNGVADACETCAGDVNCDGFVDLGDLAQLLANYNTMVGATWQMGDFDGDGDVDLSDLSALLANYGGACP